MSKTSERLEAYQTQISIYAEQHKVILASDVLDMIEQLQEDLKDDVEKVVEELDSAENYYYDDEIDEEGDLIMVKSVRQDVAIDIVRKGGVE